MRPWEIRRLTMPELALALDQDVDRVRPAGVEGQDFRHPSEKGEYAKWWRSLSMKERIKDRKSVV